MSSLPWQTSTLGQADGRHELVRVAAEQATGSAPFSCADYLQLACMGKHSVLITLLVNHVTVGRIYIVKGELWSAEKSDAVGKDALALLLFQDGLTARCHAVVEPLPPRNLDARWEALLLELARQRDEWQAKRTHSPEPDDIERAFSQLWDAALDAMLRRDHNAALAAFLAAQKLRPDDPRISANLARLSDMGIREESPL